MIDIHNHILINVDDGPKTKEDAITLLTQAKNEGVTEIVATPHHLSPQYDNSYSQVKESLEQLLDMDEVKDLGIKLYPGQEIRITDQILSLLQKGDAIGLNNSNYLLIELPSNSVPHYTKRLFFDLQSNGYIPIIAHPERNKVITQDLDILYELINSGAFSQLTSASLMGKLGKKVQKLSIQMIENNLSHFIASDAHHVTQRPFIMNSLFSNKSLQKYEENIKNFMNNAKSVIKHENIVKKQPLQEYKHKKLFGLF